MAFANQILGLDLLPRFKNCIEDFYETLDEANNWLEYAANEFMEMSTEKHAPVVLPRKTPAKKPRKKTEAKVSESVAESVMQPPTGRQTRRTAAAARSKRASIHSSKCQHSPMNRAAITPSKAHNSPIVAASPLPTRNLKINNKKVTTAKSTASSKPPVVPKKIPRLDYDSETESKHSTQSKQKGEVDEITMPTSDVDVVLQTPKMSLTMIAHEMEPTCASSPMVAIVDTVCAVRTSYEEGDNDTDGSEWNEKPKKSKKLKKNKLSTRNQKSNNSEKVVIRESSSKVTAEQDHIATVTSSTGNKAHSPVVNKSTKPANRSLEVAKQVAPSSNVTENKDSAPQPPIRRTRSKAANNNPSAVARQRAIEAINQSESVVIISPLHNSKKSIVLDKSVKEQLVTLTAEEIVTPTTSKKDSPKKQSTPELISQPPVKRTRSKAANHTAAAIARQHAVESVNQSDSTMDISPLQSTKQSDVFPKLPLETVTPQQTSVKELQPSVLLKDFATEKSYVTEIVATKSPLPEVNNDGNVTSKSTVESGKSKRSAAEAQVVPSQEDPSAKRRSIKETAVSRYSHLEENETIAELPSKSIVQEHETVEDDDMDTTEETSHIADWSTMLDSSHFLDGVPGNTSAGVPKTPSAPSAIRSRCYSSSDRCRFVSKMSLIHASASKAVSTSHLNKTPMQREQQLKQDRENQRMIERVEAAERERADAAKQREEHRKAVLEKKEALERVKLEEMKKRVALMKQKMEKEKIQERERKAKEELLRKQQLAEVAKKKQIEEIKRRRDQEEALRKQREEALAKKKMLEQKEQKRKEQEEAIRKQKELDDAIQRRKEQEAIRKKKEQAELEQKRAQEEKERRVRVAQEQWKLQQKKQQEQPPVVISSSSSITSASKENCHPALDVPAPSSIGDHYNIDDLNSDAGTDDESSPNLEVPLWARKGSRQVTDLVSKQYAGHNPWWKLYKPAEIIPLDLCQIFSGYKYRIKQRTSSAHWTTPPSESVKKIHPPNLTIKKSS